MWWCGPIIVVVGSWWQVEGGLHLHRGPAWPWPAAVWPAGPQSQSKHATGLNVAEGETDCSVLAMAVKGFYWTILVLSWLQLQLASSESIMDYLRNREDLSQVIT